MMDYYIEALVDGKVRSFHVNASDLDELHDRASDAIAVFSEEAYPDNPEAADICYEDSTFERIFVRVW